MITDVRLGDTQAVKMYRGDDVVWEKQSGGVQSGLPAEYQEVEYIESTGVQWLDTGIAATDNESLFLDWCITKYTIGTDYFGMHNPYQVLFYSWVDNPIHFYISNIDLTFKTDYNTRHIDNVIISVPDAYLHRDDILLVETHTASPLSNTGNYYAGWGNPNGSSNGNRKGCVRVYRIWQDIENNVAHDLKPCYRKLDGKTGMYDLITQDFRPNLGTGAEFLMGAEVN